MRTSRGELFASAYELDNQWRKTYERSGQHMTSEMKACECIETHGGADEFSGDTDAPTGFFYRVDRWIQTIDSQGFFYLATYDTDEMAHKEFVKLDIQYSEWDAERDGIDIEL